MPKILQRLDKIAPFSWTCPHCQRDTSITTNYYSEEKCFWGGIENSYTFQTNAIFCPNNNCRKITLEVAIFKNSQGPDGSSYKDKQLSHWKLIPHSKAKPFPEYIPKVIRDDYTEACLILDLSPKASATLSRRCLQGMVRDFWGVKAKNLHQEILAIKEKIDEDLWLAIDNIRTMGNFGAHMEKDINLIIDVEPKEAEYLIGLIEMLIEEWYIAREKRKQRINNVNQMTAEKVEQKNNGQSSS